MRIPVTPEKCAPGKLCAPGRSSSRSSGEQPPPASMRPRAGSAVPAAVRFGPPAARRPVRALGEPKQPSTDGGYADEPGRRPQRPAEGEAGREQCREDQRAAERPPQRHPCRGTRRRPPVLRPLVARVLDLPDVGGLRGLPGLLVSRVVPKSPPRPARWALAMRGADVRRTRAGFRAGRVPEGRRRAPVPSVPRVSAVPHVPAAGFPACTAPSASAPAPAGEGQGEGEGEQGRAGTAARRGVSDEPEEIRKWCAHGMTNAGRGRRSPDTSGDGARSDAWRTAHAPYATRRRYPSTALTGPSCARPLRTALFPAGKEHVRALRETERSGMLRGQPATGRCLRCLSRCGHVVGSAVVLLRVGG